MKKEGEIMARVLNRVNDANIPSYVKREIETVRDLIEDAESIKSFLTDIANELSNAHIIEETQELNIQEDIDK